MAIIITRTLIVFIAVIVSMRIMGKREFGELEPSELVVAIIISDLAANPLQDIGTPLINGLIPIFILLCCEITLSAVTMKSPFFRKILCGKPSMLVINGKINETEMRKNRFTLDELTEELRSKGIIDISKVKYAILETDGKLSTVLYAAEQPLTVAQMGISAIDAGYPSIIINDGKIIEKNLSRLGRNQRWLENELKRRKISDAKKVYLMTLNESGEIFFAAKGQS